MYFADMFLRCAGTHGRSLIFPLGNQGYRFVREGNLLASRVCILILVICSQGCRFVLEQPQGSFLEHHPRMSWLFTFLKLVRAAFWGGAFAASPESASAKRHILWSNDPPTLKAVETAAGHLSKSQLESFGMSLVNKKGGKMDQWPSMEMATCEAPSYLVALMWTQVIQFQHWLCYLFFSGQGLPRTLRNFSGAADERHGHHLGGRA